MVKSCEKLILNVRRMYRLKRLVVVNCGLMARVKSFRNAKTKQKMRLNLDELAADRNSYHFSHIDNQQGFQHMGVVQTTTHTCTKCRYLLDSSVGDKNSRVLCQSQHSTCLTLPQSPSSNARYLQLLQLLMHALAISRRRIRKTLPIQQWRE